MQRCFAFGYQEILPFKGTDVPPFFGRLQGYDGYKIFLYTVFKYPYVLCSNQKRMPQPFGIHAFDHSFYKPCVSLVFVLANKSLACPSQPMRALNLCNTIIWHFLLSHGIRLYNLILVLLCMVFYAQRCCLRNAIAEHASQANYI